VLDIVVCGHSHSSAMLALHQDPKPDAPNLIQ